MNRLSALPLLVVVLVLRGECAAKACPEQKAFTVSSADQATILSVHNTLRHKVASGKEKRGSPGPQPGTPSGKMPDLVWNSTLAANAASWAAKCILDYADRITPGVAYGQNVHWHLIPSAETKVDWTAAVTSWYDEVANVNCEQVGRNGGAWDKSRESAHVRHYTQLVWEKTASVGCAGIIFKMFGGYNELLFCNYYPAGNRVIEGVYDQVYTNDQKASCHGP